MPLHRADTCRLAWCNNACQSNALPPGIHTVCQPGDVTVFPGGDSGDGKGGAGAGAGSKDAAAAAAEGGGPRHDRMKAQQALLPTIAEGDVVHVTIDVSEPSLLLAIKRAGSADRLVKLGLKRQPECDAKVPLALAVALKYASDEVFLER